MAYELPHKPSIAVLPFDNLTGDAEQETLADGITENVITAQLITHRVSFSCAISKSNQALARAIDIVLMEQYSAAFIPQDPIVLQ